MSIRIRSFIAKLLPAGLLEAYRGTVQRYRSREYKKRTNKEIFTKIYKEKTWGENGDFFSGFGSLEQGVVNPYCLWVRDFLQSLPESQRVVVDLGCGDFRIGRSFVDLTTQYIGVDVVDVLVKRNLEKYGSPRINFVALDITREALPSGRIVLVRQVLQHLTNAEVAVVLDKIKAYDWAIITEHVPSPNNPRLRWNLDKPPGPGIRLYVNSGLNPAMEPFSWPATKIQLISSYPFESSLGASMDRGYLSTYLLDCRRNGQATVP